jgi:hypothetical protein
LPERSWRAKNKERARNLLSHDIFGKVADPWEFKDYRFLSNTEAEAILQARQHSFLRHWDMDATIMVYLAHYLLIC